MHVDRSGPASNRAPRTRGWRPLPGARGSPIPAASVLSAFAQWSSALKYTPDKTNPVARRLFRLTLQGCENDPDIYNSMAEQLGTFVDRAVIDREIEFDE